MFDNRHSIIILREQNLYDDSVIISRNELGRRRSLRDSRRCRIGNLRPFRISSNVLYSVSQSIPSSSFKIFDHISGVLLRCEYSLEFSSESIINLQLIRSKISSSCVRICVDKWNSYLFSCCLRLDNYWWRTWLSWFISKNDLYWRGLSWTNLCWKCSYLVKCSHNNSDSFSS